MSEHEVDLARIAQTAHVPQSAADQVDAVVLEMSMAGQLSHVLDVHEHIRLQRMSSRPSVPITPKPPTAR